ncbi:hypothetical protein PTKIN_Ptkin10aG0184700 [Pterospermum kingtungense]
MGGWFVFGTWGPDCVPDEFPGTGFEAGAREDVDHGCIGGEIVVAEGFLIGEEEEAEGKVGIVLQLEGNLGKLRWGETGGEQSEDGGPPGFGAVVGEDGSDCGDWVR